MSGRLPAKKKDSVPREKSAREIPQGKVTKSPSRSRIVHRKPTIIIDTREQLPYEFPEDVNTQVATLATGDYSVMGYTPFIAVERKSWADFYGCLTGGRDRFERCLERLSQMRYPVVVIEASIADFDKPFFYRDKRGRICASQLPPSVAKKTLIAWEWRYRVPIRIAGSGELSRDGNGHLACGDLPGYTSKSKPDGRDKGYWGRAKKSAMKWTMLLLDDAVRVILRESKESKT